VEHAVVYGDGKKYLVAGIWLQHEAVAGELAKRSTSADDRARVTDELVASAVEKINGDLASFERIKRFRIMETPLTVASGLLTSTLKVRRKKVYEVFHREFESLYDEAR
jgi:long-chain acyl-CoA synthetase